MSFGRLPPSFSARDKVKPNKVQEYLFLAAKTDKAVEDSEPNVAPYFDPRSENHSMFCLVQFIKTMSLSFLI